MQETAHEVPNGAGVALRGQVTTMTSAYQQLFVGLALAFVLIYLLIVVKLPVLARSVRDRRGAATALAGIVWMLFAKQYHPFRSRAHWAIMCHGRRDRQQHSW